MPCSTNTTQGNAKHRISHMSPRKQAKRGNAAGTMSSYIYAHGGIPHTYDVTPPCQILGGRLGREGKEKEKEGELIEIYRAGRWG